MRISTRQLVTYLLIATSCALFSLPTHAVDELRVEDNRIQADFPSSVTFYLTVSGPALIEEVELEYGVTQVACGPASAKARPDFEPSNKVRVSWTWDFRKSGSPPPGARIWWRWHVQDEAGDQLEVAEQEHFFDDPRYDWSEIRSDELVLLSAVPDEALNQALWEAANHALERLEGDIGARPERLVKIYNYPSTQDLRDARVHVQDWTGALALYAYQTILLGVNQDELDWGQRCIAHELAHIVIHQVTFNCLGDLPTWLDEGLAAYAEGDLSDTQREALDQAIATDDLIALQSLSGTFPTSSRRASLAYAQSRQVVSYLIKTYGQEKMAELLQTFKEGTSYDKALQRVYGLDTQELNNQWRVSLGLLPRQIVATATSILPPTLALYSASTPTAMAAPTGILASPPITATPSPSSGRKAAVPPPTPKAASTVRPTAASLPAPTLAPAAPALAVSPSPLALVIGGVVVVAALLAASVALSVRRRG